MIKTWNSHKSFKVFNILAISLFLSACSLPEFEGEDPGALVEFSSEKIDEAFESELSKVHLEQIKVGDMVEYETSVVAENGASQPLEDKRRTVKKSDWTSNPSVVVMDYMYKDHYDDSNSFTRDEIWEFNNSTVSALAAKSLESFFPFNDDDEPTVEVKYYNFKAQRRVVQAPDKAKNKNNCGGLLGCVIQGVQVEYLVHIVKDGKVAERREYKEFISHQIPPLFVVDTQDPYGAMYPIAQSCVRTLFSGVLANVCTTISDVDIQ